MADPFATYADIENAWRALTSDEQTVATSSLAFASAIIRNDIRTVDSRIAAGKLDVDLVKHIAVAMVLRKMRNPDGLRTEQLEDYAYTRDSALSDGSIYLSADERRMLLGRGAGAFSIAPGDDPPSYATVATAQAWRDSWR